MASPVERRTAVAERSCNRRSRELSAATGSVANLRLMFLLATDWATISSLVTGAGTLVLAVATFAAVRSSNRSARIAEAALQEQRRPVLAPSRLEDPLQKLMFVDEHWVSAAGGRAAAEHVDGSVYLAISLRNVGSGIAVCQGWAVRPGFGTSRTMPTPAALEEFRLQTRDLYIPAGDIGMWQGALRNPDDPVRAATAAAIDARQPITIELLYSDQVGLQRTITRFGLIPTAESWLVSVSRHWYLDWDGPRPENAVRAAVDVVQRDWEAAERRASAARETTAAPNADGATRAARRPSGTRAALAADNSGAAGEKFPSRAALPAGGCVRCPRLAGPRTLVVTRFVDARVHVDFTEREARSLVRAAALVTDVLRPELFTRDRPGAESPLVTACQVLIGACERAGIEARGAGPRERGAARALSPAGRAVRQGRRRSATLPNVLQLGHLEGVGDRCLGGAAWSDDAHVQNVAAGPQILVFLRRGARGVFGRRCFAPMPVGWRTSAHSEPGRLAGRLEVERCPAGRRVDPLDDQPRLRCCDDGVRDARRRGLPVAASRGHRVGVLAGTGGGERAACAAAAARVRARADPRTVGPLDAVEARRHVLAEVERPPVSR